MVRNRSSKCSGFSCFSEKLEKLSSFLDNYDRVSTPLCVKANSRSLVISPCFKQAGSARFTILIISTKLLLRWTLARSPSANTIEGTSCNRVPCLILTILLESIDSYAQIVSRAFSNFFFARSSIMETLARLVASFFAV
jgi:hypothetical protein